MLRADLLSILGFCQLALMQQYRYPLYLATVLTYSLALAAPHHPEIEVLITSTFRTHAMDWYVGIISLKAPYKPLLHHSIPVEGPKMFSRNSYVVEKQFWHR